MSMPIVYTPPWSGTGELGEQSPTLTLPQRGGQSGARAGKGKETRSEGSLPPEAEEADDGKPRRQGEQSEDRDDWHAGRLTRCGRMAGDGEARWCGSGNRWD